MDVNRIVSIVLNSIIVVIMIFITVFLFKRDGKWSLSNIKKPLRYYTFQSNVLCAVAALLMIIFPNVYPVWVVKYVATATITVTILTVFLFLSHIYGFKRLLSGRDFWMHLINPVLAIVSFCVFERNHISFPIALIGILPVILYGLFYGYHVMIASEEKRWEDFYGFNKSNKWYLAVIFMLLGTFAVCMGLMLIQNTGGK